MKKLMILCLFFSSHVFAAPVNINNADAKAISTALKGVGQKKAEEIIKYRTANGKFKAVGDLAKVPGIGAKTVEKNKADILLVDSKKK